MRVRVSFRVNTTTGEVETFLIEDTGTEIEPEHEATHDRIAYEVGRIVERRPTPSRSWAAASRRGRRPADATVATTLATGPGTGDPPE